ncbi:hypothetical protein HK405_001227, partial [Cladochytrium tenue]
MSVYGLGYVYLQQDKLELAEFHFRKALALNQENPLLLVYLGLVAEKRDNWTEALARYEAASARRPDVAVFRYRRALALHHLGRDGEALAVARELAEGGSGGGGGAESGVLVLLGRVYRSLGQRREALGAFAAALDAAAAAA